MRYTNRDGNYTGRDRKLWELENKIEDGELTIKKATPYNYSWYFSYVDIDTGKPVQFIRHFARLEEINQARNQIINQYKEIQPLVLTDYVENFYEHYQKGEFIRLPCKVRDVVYIIIYSELKIFEYKIKEIHICYNDTYFLLNSSNEDLPICYRKMLTNLSMINENWYLDKTKAEERLKELEDTL